MNHDPETVRFGRTVMHVTIGDNAMPVQAAIIPANARGIVSTNGLAGPAGSASERALREHAPIRLGDAVLTAAGESVALSWLIHAVVSREPWDAPHQPAVEPALAAALAIVDQQRLQTVSLPLLGATESSDERHRQACADMLVDVLVAHLRRRPTRLVEIVFTVRDQRDQEIVAAAARRSRARDWLESA